MLGWVVFAPLGFQFSGGYTVKVPFGTTLEGMTFKYIILKKHSNDHTKWTTVKFCLWFSFFPGSSLNKELHLGLWASDDEVRNSWPSKRLSPATLVTATSEFLSSQAWLRLWCSASLSCLGLLSQWPSLLLALLTNSVNYNINFKE